MDLISIKKSIRLICDLNTYNFFVREMDNRDDQKIPPAGSYMHSPGVLVNQPPPMKTASSPAAPYPVQHGETAPLYPPSYTTVVGPQQNQNIPPNKGFH